MFSIIFRKGMMFSIAVVILSAISLHTIIFHHEHPEFMGDKFEAALYGEDKKRLNATVTIPVFVIIFLAVLLLGYLIGLAQSPVGQRYLDSSVLKPYIFLSSQLRRGILHSRVPW